MSTDGFNNRQDFERYVDRWYEKTRKELVGYVPSPPSAEVADMRRSFCHWPRQQKEVAMVAILA